MDKPIEVGDIIDGRRVTKVFALCGGLAYQSEPVAENAKAFPEELPELGEKIKPVEIIEKPKRGRKRKE